jgi:hypothetical protein
MVSPPFDNGLPHETPTRLAEMALMRTFNGFPGGILRGTTLYIESTVAQ